MRDEFDSQANGWSFVRFLSFLHNKPDVAGRIFVDMHRKLVMFAEAHQVSDPQEFADKALKLLGERRRNESIRNPAFLAYTIAQSVLKEDWRQRRAAPLSISGTEATLRSTVILSDPTNEVSTIERRHKCLERCLGLLSADERSMILDYYRIREGASKLHEARKALAVEHGVKTKTLAVSMCRIHKKLNPCVIDCMGGSDV